MTTEEQATTSSLWNGTGTWLTTVLDSLKFPFLRNLTECQEIPDLVGLNGTAGSVGVGIDPSLQLWQILIIFLMLGCMGATLATIFNAVRRNFVSGKDNLDTDFDAGGKVSAGLTATTIVSQWTWAATLLQSSGVAARYGISGPFWYAAGATIQVMLFSMISVQLKIRAPGAKTFLQVIKARFGKKTHIVYCFFALMTNIIVTAMLMLGGAAVLTNLVKGLSVEMATAMTAAVIGTYTFIGGLGATFYVSYFNTSVIFLIMLIFLVKVYHEPGNLDNPLGSASKVFELLDCSQAPDGNLENSYVTMVSNPGLMFGIINIVGNFGTVFVDQSYWQSSVAAKPKQGVWGFLIGAMVWFAVPFTFATTMGLSFIALSAREGQALLSDDEISAGLVAPVVAQKMMGESGEILVVLMVLMAVTSTGSAEVIAVTSILVYDVYQLYLKPYRLVLDSNSCILCGRARGRQANPRDKCRCISMTFCPDCAKDDEHRDESKRAIKPPFKCTLHGPYRMYSEFLVSLKNWCVLWVTLAIIPLTMILYAMQVSLGWVYLFMGVLIGSAVIPIALCMFWTKLTGSGMIVGAIGGAVIGITVWLAVASTYDGGLNKFFENTGAEVSMLCGNLCSILCGGLLTIIVSLATNRTTNPDEIWESTRDIDNPLSPWTELYARDLDLKAANQLDNRPPLADVSKTFRSARIMAYIGAISLTIVLIFVWPAATLPSGVFSFPEFNSWVNVCQAWGFIAAIVIIIMPVVNEVIEIRSNLAERNKIDVVEAQVEDMVFPDAPEKDADVEAAKPAANGGENVIENVTENTEESKSDNQGPPEDPREPVFAD